jgi:hypothetical protein
VFISALDTIVEASHRSRTQRGLMHPSVNDRIALLRRLASDPLAVKRFDRSMRRIRLAIAAMLAAGIGAAVLAGSLDQGPKATSQPARVGEPGRR